MTNIKLIRYVGVLLLIIAILSSCVVDTNQIDYIFGEHVAEQHQEEFVDNTNEVVKYVSKVLGTSFTLSFDVSTNTLSQDGHISISKNISNKDLVSILLKQHFGETCNYGLINGLTVNITKEVTNELPVLSITEETSIEFLITNPMYSTFDYPAFTKNYSDSETISFLEATSYYFSKYIIDVYGVEKVVELLNDENSTYEYYRLLNEWIASKGYSMVIESLYSEIKFSHSPGEHLVVWYTDGIKWIVHEGFEDHGTLPYGKYEMTSSYSKLVYHAETLLNDIEVLSNLPIFSVGNNTKELVVEFVDNDFDELEESLGRYTPYYAYRTDRILITGLVYFAHEYIHYLSDPYHVHSRFVGEAVAEYYSYYSSYYVNDLVASLEKYPEIYNLIISDYITVNGTKPNFHDDLYLFLEILPVVTVEIDEDLDVLSYKTAPFFHYLLEEYGNGMHYELLVNDHTIEYLTGKSWEELDEEWKEYMYEKYISIMQ